ncbi:hypothetical protein ACU4GD_26230 [Cupriavidus basilensis]
MATIFPESDFISWKNASGVPVSTLNPMASSLAFISGFSTACLSAPFNLAMTAFGVPLGTSMPT